MHEYLRTIGFSSYKTRSDINKLLYMLQRRYVNNDYALSEAYLILASLKWTIIIPMYAIMT